MEVAPLVDEAVIKLARHVTLPVDDAVSFKDISERKIGTELKKIYTSAGSACKRSLTLMSVAKVIGAWAETAELLAVICFSL